MTRYFCIHLLLISLVGCSQYTQSSVSHYTQNISCINKVDEASYQRMIELTPHALPGLYATEETFVLEKIAKKNAHAGDGESMQIYGGIKFMLSVPNDVWYEVERNEPVTLPNYIKEDIIEAVTYSYLAVEVENEYRGEALSQIKQFERRHSAGEIPHMWLKAAKMNVEKWKKRCGLI